MKITLANRMVLLLAERKIRMATDFARLLAEHGYTISSSQASRYLKDEMPSMSLDFIQAVCNALNCTPNELFEMKVTYEPGEVPDPRVRLPVHAAVTGGAESVPAASRPASPEVVATATGPTSAKTPWTGKHPVSGPRMTPIPSIGKKKE